MGVETFLSMTEQQRLDAFFADTFQPHTHRDKVMTFGEIMEYYQQWCEATGCAPTARHYHMGRALEKRYFFVRIGNKKLWFCEVRQDLIDDIEEKCDGLL